MRPVIEKASQLEQYSSWRIFQAGLRELELLEAPKEVIKEYTYQAARSCFLAFANLMMDGKLKVEPFHEIIASGFEDVANWRYPRLIVSCPPRSGKSLLSQLFVAWLIGRDQQSQHIIASYGQQLSSKFFRGIVGYLKHKDFGKIFPDWLGFNPDSKYEIAGGGFILATSVGGVLTGFTAGTPSEDNPGVGAIVVDDPLKGSDSRAALEALDTWWGEQASTRRTNRWAQILIGTRFHERDLHGLLMDGDGLYDREINPMGWRWINIPGICENEAADPLERKNGESHWPSNPIFTTEMLLSQKRAMGSNKFAALYQGQPTAQEGSIVKASWIQTLPIDQCPEFDITYLSLDTAFSEKQEADESVICVAGFSRKNPKNIYIREIISGRWSFPDLLAMVNQTQKYYNAKFLTIEQAASGQSLIQVLERENKIQVHAFKPLKSKTVRLQTVCPLLESGKVWFVDGAWVPDLIKEITGFPHVPHDDKTDAVVWALTYFLFHIEGSNQELKSFIKNTSGTLPKLIPEDHNTNTNNYSSQELFFGQRKNLSGKRRGLTYDISLD